MLFRQISALCPRGVWGRGVIAYPDLVDLLDPLAAFGMRLATAPWSPANEPPDRFRYWGLHVDYLRANIASWA